jgi:hypothetical protein
MHQGRCSHHQRLPRFALWPSSGPLQGHNSGGRSCYWPSAGETPEIVPLFFLPLLVSSRPTWFDIIAPICFLLPEKRGLTFHGKALGVGHAAGRLHLLATRNIWKMSSTKKIYLQWPSLHCIPLLSRLPLWVFQRTFSNTLVTPSSYLWHWNHTCTIWFLLVKPKSAQIKPTRVVLRKCAGY